MNPNTRCARTAAATGALMLLMSLVSCLPVPLGDPEKSQTDAKLTGVWHYKQSDGGTLIAIAPADSHVYVMQWVDYKKSGNDLTIGTHAALRAWLTDVKGQRFITSQMLAQMVNLKADTGYGVFRLATKGDGIEVTSLDEKFDGFKDVKDPAALAKVVEQNLDNPKMYNEPSLFTKLDPNQEQDKPLIELLGK